jgi:hypothetical protein
VLVLVGVDVEVLVDVHVLVDIEANINLQMLQDVECVN